MKKTLAILAIALLFHIESNAAWISITKFSVDTTNSQVKINYTITEVVSGWYINKHEVYYNANQDTLNVRVFRLYYIISSAAPKTIDSTITITPNNFNKLCYLNFYNAADTNTVNPQLHYEIDGYDIDTANYNFNHCAPLSIGKQTADNAICIFPNPSYANWVVDCSNAAQTGCSYTITDVYGKTMYTNTSKANKFTIDNTTFSTGIYLLHVNVNGILSTYRLIKL